MQSAIDADLQPGMAQARAAQKARAANDAAAARDAADKGRGPKPTGPAGKVEPQPADAASPALQSAPVRTTSSRRATPSSYPYYSFPARTAGKVFFTNASNGLNYVCSGTIVNSEGKDTVWTAGHCVHGGAGGTWHYNWVFVPAYNYGWAPYGYWYANQLWTMTAWMSSSDSTSDMGAAIMNRNAGGWRIVDYFGGQGITWNQSKSIYVTSFGYPAASPFNGQSLWLCSGWTFPEWTFLWWSADTLGLSCDMTGGSSGGAWLAFFNGTTGYIDGHNDNKYDNDPNTMYSPYYDDTASALYNAVRYL
jgi:V8-like Glu-specific endopeptidase